ncbi:MAG: sugar phosphate isomerase/epimerase [candidate division KSB1 bacterium]|nr:sugar phosphate isomerase/epimerase [candidate division KSB1 bacterium]MDZ7302522.1 sugar phosphate isomerase/epimerase [candidate division KSB1 bacterium]MDZ7311883.1 sugar phosphate isomerase/epimerase [candidate division KSB1 bacterium]
MELGLYFAVCNHLELEPALEKVAKLGYTCLELSMHTGGRFDVAEMLKDGKGRQISSIIKNAGLRVSAINMSADGQLVLGPHHADTDVIFKGTSEEKIRYGTERMFLAAELANELEIPVVTGFTGCEDYSRWFPWPDPTAWERMEPVFVERWSPILKRFDELGIRFGMECHPRQIVYNTETALRSVELLGSYRSWCFNLDPANLMLAGVDPVVFVAELGLRIVNVHAKDGELVVHNVRRSGLLAHGAWDRPDRGFRFRIAGWGDVPWRRLITELILQGYQGPLTVEHEDATMGPMDGIEKAAHFLTPLLIREPFPGRWW